MTTDNASANIPLVETSLRLILTKYNVPVNTNTHICCILHAVNLSVQDTLHALDEVPNPNVEDYYNTDKQAPAYWDPEEDNDQLALNEEANLSNEEQKKAADKDMSVNDEDILEQLSDQSALKRVCSTASNFSVYKTDSNINSFDSYA